MAEKRRPDFRRIPISRTFTVEGIATALGRQPATVRLWIRQGLPTIDDALPPMVHGSVLREWLGVWWGKRRSPCAANEFYCPTCRVRHRALDNTISVASQRPNTTTLASRCPTCGRVLYKFTTPQRAVEALFQRQLLSGKESRLSRRDISPDNPSDSETQITSAPDTVANLERGEKSIPPSGKQNDGSIQSSCRELAVFWNAPNERVKAQYFDFRSHADGMAAISIVKLNKAIRRYEEMTKGADFRTFNAEKAKTFKQFLADAGIVPASIDWTLHALRHFFDWLRTQPGYRRKIVINDVAYLRRSRKERRAANSRPEKTYPTVAMVEKAIAAMPFGTAVEKRDRALVAFLCLSSIRVGAVISLKLKHYDPDRHLVSQNPLEVNTKNSKRIETVLVPNSEPLERIFLEYIRFLREELGFADEDPMFPKSPYGASLLKSHRLSREHWSTTQNACKIVRAAFKAAGLPAFGPHRFRDLAVAQMRNPDLSTGQILARSKNLGHSKPNMSFQYYGDLPLEEQIRLIRNPVVDDKDAIVTKLIEEFVRKFPK